MMLNKDKLEPGLYVVAVSGGVDSVVLLHQLLQCPDLRLVVAHFDHGIRPESGSDRVFVQELAKKYGLPFVFDIGHLGPNASEETARMARYGFLRRVREVSGARAIITAHHQDDATETAIINLIRGTGRRGLTSLRSTDDIKRPLLAVPKKDIYEYARQHQLSWHEDSTNTDTQYLRNHVRHKVVPRLQVEDLEKFQRILMVIHQTNQTLDSEIDSLLDVITKDGRLNRYGFIMLPHAMSLEVMAAWLRKNGIRGFDKSMLERATQAAKIYTAGRKVDLVGRARLVVAKHYLALDIRER